MTDIFLSYTESDRDAARRIAGVLRTTGWTVWWDRRIPAGETWRSVLEDALENMRCMVVLWSARSIESEWVYEEA
ncbi:MAG: toll/interleukin-1 receptor domain-containing protein, partial [Propionivibrio sp.]